LVIFVWFPDEELNFGNEEDTLDVPNVDDFDFIQDAEWQCVRVVPLMDNLHKCV